MPFSLSLVIPAYNEAPRLSKSLHAIFDYLKQQSYDSEVIVVDDGSTDETTAVAERSFADAGRTSARVIRVEPNRGKGNAVREGLLAARAPIALFSDADLSTPITETPKVVAPIRSGEYDVVFGSRALDRSLIGVHQPWRREQGGRAVNLLVRLTTGLPIWDTQCGFKAFRMDVCRPVVEAATIDRFGFDIELLYASHLAGLRLLERAVRWDHNDGSKLSPLRDGLRMLEEVWTIRTQARKGAYERAIAQVRELTRRADTRAPILADNTAAPESDVPPELASAEHRI
jgi:glycosyltransferase involved in cell wall biosynthesis